MPCPPKFVPELVTLAVTAPMPVAPPEMVPELFTTAVTTPMPTPFAAVAKMLPELVTLAVVPEMPSMLPEMVPELMMVAVVALIPRPIADIPWILPKLVTVAVSAKIPAFVPVTVAPGSTVTPKLNAAPPYPIFGEPGPWLTVVPEHVAAGGFVLAAGSQTAKLGRLMAATDNATSTTIPATRKGADHRKGNRLRRPSSGPSIAIGAPGNAIPAIPPPTAPKNAQSHDSNDNLF